MFECKARRKGVNLIRYVNTFFLFCYNKFEWLLATLLKTLCGTKANRVFSHDVVAAILVFQNDETAAILVYQTNQLSSFLM